MKQEFVIIGILILVLVLGFFLFKKLFKNDETGKSNKEIIKSELSFADADYERFANSLYQAMNGSGTNETTIYEVLGNLKNKSDFYQLVKSFDVRTNDGMFSKNIEGTLAEWFNYELDDTELKKVKEIILTKTGVTF